MTVNSQQRGTLAPENQFIVACPVFETDVKIASCYLLRDMWARGERIEQRKGCQVALRACKCPIPQTIKNMMRDGDDPYFASEPRKGTFKQDVLKSIRPILIQTKDIDKADCSETEKAKLRKCNDNAAPTNGPISASKPRKKQEALPAAGKPEVSGGTAAIVDAATSGDLGAAISSQPENPS